MHWDIFMTERQYTILVLDMQPIDPPVGGGRLRLFGLYHDLGLPTQYIGSYDWPGEKYRDHFVSKTLREIDIPLSGDHFAACKKIQDQVNGKTVIDTTFHQFAHLSPEYVNFVKRETEKADVVVFSHPWVYPIVKDQIDSNRQLVIYDSQNVEGYLRYTLLDDGASGTEIVREVVRIEHDLSDASDYILVCSHEDGNMFHHLYGAELKKMKLVPNGTFTDKIKPYLQNKTMLKKRLGLDDRPVAIFMGSNYGPNLEACDFIIGNLALCMPEVLFVIAGGVGDGIERAARKRAKNVKITGFVNEDEKIAFLSAADIAINPMLSGSGTNIKMFDFMAAGLPIITTPTGSRGITDDNFAGIILSDETRYAESLRNLIGNSEEIVRLGHANRAEVERNYSWEKISPELGTFLFRKLEEKKKRSLPDEESARTRRLALLTTWDIRCGIAEYSRYLAEALSSLGGEPLIIANAHDGIRSSLLGDLIEYDVWPLWTYDSVNYSDSKINISAIVQLLHKKNINRLYIQYHHGFMHETWLLRLTEACRHGGVKAFVTLHNSSKISHETLSSIDQGGVHFFVHTSQEKKTLRKTGIINVSRVHHGIIDFPDEDTLVARQKLKISHSRVIGSFGFLRPHKGILELIEAVGKLKEKIPDILFLGMHALYPSQDSRDLLTLCLNKIRELHLQNNVILKTDFIGIQEIIAYLHAADIVVLPYHDSDEGSSATAHMAISAKRPLITSRSIIFRDIEAVCSRLDSIEPAEMSEHLFTVLSDHRVLNALKCKVVQYAKDHSWRTAAEEYLTPIADGTIFDDALDKSELILPLNIPEAVQQNLTAATAVIDEVRKIVGLQSHGDYFETSLERYAHYIAAAMSFLKKGSLILDVGNAPGHVGIGLHLLGMKIQGINLNNAYVDTYPSKEWLNTFNVIAHNIEMSRLPFGNDHFDAVYFTEVLEHIAVKNPFEIINDLWRVLKPGGVLVLSTPNVCNISNLYALVNGNNIFWPSDMFYGSLDRHNREYTPKEVYNAVSLAGFDNITMYGINCHSNWRSEGASFANDMISKQGDRHPLLRNTIMVFARK
jgi:glycosyltransferase involved in cell wall biosynthesis/2-polyprenyl-3-methyl-5-hydroxy-6-metoxy-1,4-benzoquinol methylase